MTPQRWAQIEELFHRVVDCPPEQRYQFLAEACSGDSELRGEVEVLLASDERASNRMQAAVHGGMDAMSFPLVGKIVSHYRILDGLGGGGMGLVYRAEDIKLGRQVALKFLPEESAKDPAALGRFEREARSASSLEHPNICPIYEFGEHEGQPFLVMQLLQGQTLRELLSSRDHAKPPLEISKVLDLALQIAEGLQAAHRHGIIHRDVKPANIFITEQGQAKILDFGLAKLTSAGYCDEELDQAAAVPAGSHLGAQDFSPQATPDPLLSRTGVAMGTAGYMSPEQARGEKLDARTDVFSFGLVLYEMATGQRAFKGDTGPVLHDAILRGTPVSARKLNLTIPSKLDAVLRKTLEKEPANRYHSAQELRDDLLGLQRTMRAHRRLWQWLPISAGVLVVLTGGIYFLERRHSSAIQSLPQVQFRQLTINSSENPVECGSLSPDGTYLAYLDQEGMHIKDLRSGTVQAVPQPDGLPQESVTWEIQDAAWLRDSSAFIANAHPANETPSKYSSATTVIWSFSRLGARPRKLRENAWFWEVLPDNSISFGTNHEHESWLMGPDGERAHKLLETDENSGLVGPLGQSSADKQIILYDRHDSSGDWLLTRNLRGGPPVTVFTAAETQQMPGDFAWLPDGRLIYEAKEYGPGNVFAQDSCNFWALRLDLHSGKPVGKPERLTNWTGFCSGQINVTADGKRVAFLRVSGHGTGYLAKLAAGGTRIADSRHFTLEEADDYIADWTADGKMAILLSNYENRHELLKQSLTGGTPQLLASMPTKIWATQAVLSGDGKWILVQTYDGPNEPNSFWRVPINGGSPELIFKGPEWFASVTCARPPSSQCVTIDLSEDYKQAVVSNLDPIRGRGTELVRFAFEPGFDPRANIALWNLSPDGTRFAISRSAAGPLQIYSFKDHSTRLIRLKNHVDMLNLTWSADGKAFYFANRTKDGMEILHMDMRGNTASLWKNNGRSFCTPSPDGQYLAIYAGRRVANFWTMENF